MPLSYFERHYWVERQIAESNYSRVYTCMKRSTGETYVVKVENDNCLLPQLSHENNVYNRIHVVRRVPGIISPLYYGRHRSKRVLVMPYLGPSVAAKRRALGGSLSESTVCLIGLQMLFILEDLHERTIIHTDLKPQNILTSRDGRNLHLIDFGLAQKFKDPEGHYPFRSGRSFFGNVKFASANKHVGYSLSRRDDIESLGYCLLSLRNGGLPWDTFCHRISLRLRRSAGAMKCSLSERELCLGMPSMMPYFQIQRRLGFEEKPDYGALRSVLIRRLSHMGYRDPRDIPFDWQVPRGSDRLRRSNTRH